MKINSIIHWFLYLLMSILFIFLIYAKDYEHAFLALLSLIIFLIPTILKHRYDVNLPWIFDILIEAPLLIFVFGSSFKFYRYEAYHALSHFTGTIIIALLAFAATYALNATKKVKLSTKQIMLFTIVFAIAIGALFDVSELLSDMYLGTTTTRGNLELLDIFWDSMSAVVTAFVGAWYIKHAPKHKVKKNIIDPFDTLLNIRK